MRFVRGSLLVVVVAVLVSGVTGCSGNDEPGAASPPSVASSPTIVSQTSMNLTTHCGVRWATIGDKVFWADPVLDDGMGNAPSGWGGGVQPGTMYVYDDGRAKFDDGAGHVAWFRPATAADPKFLCA
jgi:hypothetical protein